MFRIEEINDLQRLADYRLLWNLLLSQTPEANFFQSFDWLQAYWQHYGHDQQLRVLLVWADEELVGILPLVVRREPSRAGRLRVLTYPLHDWGSFYGPLGSNPTATLVAGLRHVHRTPRDWDWIDLRWVDADGRDGGRTETAMRQVGFTPRRQAWKPTALIETGGGWQEYWGSRDKKFRHNVERCAASGRTGRSVLRPLPAARGGLRRRRSPLGPLRRMRHAGSTQLAGLLDRRHDAQPRAGCRLPPRRPCRGRAAGGLDLSLLRLNGQPIAFIYGYHYDGHVDALRQGFDPQWAAYRPGLVLQQRVLEDGCRRGDRTFDLGVGSLDVKRHWQTSLPMTYRFAHFPATVSRVQLLRLKRWFLERIHGEQHQAG